MKRGRFLTKEKWRPTVRDPSVYIEVRDTEEKGSDVNLASFLLNDGYLDRYDGGVANRALVTCFMSSHVDASFHLTSLPP